MISTLALVEYTCDARGHRCWFSSATTPKGWVTTREDHSNSFCPDCNPWLTRMIEPDLNKLQKCNT